MLKQLYYQETNFRDTGFIRSAARIQPKFIELANLTISLKSVRFLGCVDQSEIRSIDPHRQIY